MNIHDDGVVVFAGTTSVVGAASDACIKALMASCLCSQLVSHDCIQDAHSVAFQEGIKKHTQIKTNRKSLQLSVCERKRVSADANG